MRFKKLITNRFKLKRPRLKVSPQLQPMGSMQKIKPSIEAEPFEWNAEDGKAGFYTVGSLPMTGWNMLEIEIEHDQMSAAACLTLDVGHGFDSHKSIYLSVRRGRIAKRICFIPLSTKRLRLEPLAGNGGFFSIKRFRFVWLTPRFAYSRMIRRLNYADRHFQGSSSQRIIDALHQEGREENINWKRLLIAYYEATFARGAPNFDYALWQEQIEPLREPSVNRVRIDLEKLAFKPCFGFLLVGGSLSPREIRQTLNSLLLQRYPFWYVLISKEQFEQSEILQAVNDVCAADKRLKEHLLVDNTDGGLPHWLETLTSKLDYLSFLSIGDQLGINAVYHLAVHAQNMDKSMLVYADEDCLLKGDRVFPNFKPSWNPDLLLSTNYIGLASAFRLQRLLRFTQQIKNISSLDLHALLLAYTQDLSADQINHAAYVVLHCDSDKDSNLKGINYSLSGVSDYLKESGYRVEVSEVPGSGCHVSWDVPSPAPHVTMLIPTRNMVHILKPCVDTILELTDYTSYELVILDNQSDEPETLSYLKEIQQDPRVRVIRWDYPFNYSAINNYGVKHSQGDIIALVNNDIEPINAGWLTEMVGQVSRPEVGCVGAKLYYPNDTVQHGGVILGLGGVAGHAHRFFPRDHKGFQNRLVLTQDLTAVTAACLLVRREVYEQAGGLEEEHLPVAYNDVDFCLKVHELGYRNIWTPFAELYHHESVSRGLDDNPVKKARAKKEVDYFRSRWSQEILHDPAYNPNLTVSFEDFSLR